MQTHFFYWDGGFMGWVHCFAKTCSLDSSMSNVNANCTQMACLSLKGPIVIIHIILWFLNNITSPCFGVLTSSTGEAYFQNPLDYGNSMLIIKVKIQPNEDVALTPNACMKSDYVIFVLFINSFWTKC
jgi:hypothetical protein